MKNKIWLLAFGMLVSLFSISGEAVDLMEVYRDAALYDPEFRAAKAEWQANQEELSITRADLWPTLTASAQVGYNREDKYIESFHSKERFESWGWQLSLRQPLFDFHAVSNHRSSKFRVRAAYMQFLASESSLLYKVTERYLDVLLTEDVLAYTEANKLSTKQLLDQVQRKFEVGLVAITDLEEAKTNYDLALAAVIEAQKNVSNAREALWELTGKYYECFNTLQDQLPLISPEPDNLDRWVEYAKEHNFALKGASYRVLAAKEDVKGTQAGHLPVVSAQVSYGEGRGRSDLPDVLGRHSIADNSVFKGTVGAEMALFNGGQTVANVQRAKYIYDVRVAEQEQVHRQVVSGTRQAYLTTKFYINKIQADLQAIRSVESALKATYASYTVGSRTMADVLDRQTSLYNTQSSFAQDEYEYVKCMLKLKRLVGRLTIADLEQINGWLTDKPKTADKGILSELASQIDKN